MSETQQAIENLKELLKAPGKHFINFPIKDLPEKQLILQQVLENPEIREALTKEELNDFNEKAIVGLMLRLLNMNEVIQEKIKTEVINTLKLQQRFLKEEFQKEEPNTYLLEQMKDIYMMSKNFYQHNHYIPEDAKDGEKEDEKVEETNQDKEIAQRMEEDRYEASKGISDADPVAPTQDIEGSPNKGNQSEFFDQDAWDPGNQQDSSAETVSSESPSWDELTLLASRTQGVRIDCRKQPSRERAYDPNIHHLSGVDPIWARATATYSDGMLTIKFDRESEDFNLYVTEDTYIPYEVAPIDKHSYADEQWRLSLKNNSGGGYVDCFLKGFGWCEARVMASMTNMDETVDQVLLQIVKVPLGKSKNVGSFKELEFPQISIRDPIIRKRGTKFEDSNEEEIELHEMNRPHQPAGPVSKRIASKHTVLKLIIKEFFALEMHTVLINRVKDSEHPINLKLFIDFCDYFVNTSRIADEEYKSSYIDDFHGAIEEYLNSETFIKSIKEFKPDYFDTLNKAHKKIVLEVALRCLQTESLGTRVHGIKEIESICTKCFKGHSFEIKRDDLGELLSKNNVIESIFGPNHHSELINRSEFILKVLSRSKIGIREDEMKMIWNLTKRDSQTKLEVYAALRAVGESLSKEFIEFLMDKILEFKHMTSQDLSFMFSFKNKTAIQNE